jgi:molybdopterin-synthase adenylyltransferase
MHITYHEALYRNSESMKRLQGRLVTVCGAGALGANLCESLSRSGIGELRVIDRDRVEEHNLSTQPYQLDDVGARKAETLAASLYRAVGIEMQSVSKELNAQNVQKLLHSSELVVDCFDNSVARAAVTDHCLNVGIPCLHVGLADGYAEVIWNESYRVPSAGQDDICDYPLARNLVTMAVGVASETVIRFLIDGTRPNWSVTLGDLSVRTLEM